MLMSQCLPAVYFAKKKVLIKINVLCEFFKLADFNVLMFASNLFRKKVVY